MEVHLLITPKGSTPNNVIVYDNKLEPMQSQCRLITEDRTRTMLHMIYIMCRMVTLKIASIFIFLTNSVRVSGRCSKDWKWPEKNVFDIGDFLSLFPSNASLKGLKGTLRKTDL